MTIAEFDKLSVKKKKELLTGCCPSTAWVKEMMEIFPVNDLVDLLEYAEEKWFDCNPADWQEAFKHHAKSNDKFAPENFKAHVVQHEAAAESKVKKSVLPELEEARKEYRDTFGYDFIVFVTGKSAKALLRRIRKRMQNDPEEELTITAGEQFKIMRQRIKNLFA